MVLKVALKTDSNSESHLQRDRFSATFGLFPERMKFCILGHLKFTDRTAQLGEIFHRIFHESGKKAYFYWTPLLCPTIFAVFLAT